MAGAEFMTVTVSLSPWVGLQNYTAYGHVWIESDKFIFVHRNAMKLQRYNN